MGRILQGLTLLVMVLFIGIPTAANFYPPQFAGVAEVIPLEFVFTWMTRIGIFAFGVLIGWLLRGGELRDLVFGVDEADGEVEVSSIEGCIEKGDVAWKGVAEISNALVESTEVPYAPCCPKCQTKLNSEKVELIGRSSQAPYSSSTSTSTTNIWTCPSSGCDHTTTRESRKHDEAKNLFDSHAKKLVETEGKPYSMDTLLEEAEHDITPRQVWELYSEAVDDPEVTMSCFP